MLDVPVYTVEGKQIDKMPIDEAQLGGRVRAHLLKQAIVMYQANQRLGTAATKCRSMVEGSTRKLYRQKGTGNARMGAIRTPQRRGGGRAFAKRPRDFRLSMPKRMRRLACRNALLARILAKDVLIFDTLDFDRPQTARLRAAFEAVGAADGCLLALHEPHMAVIKSGRNLPKTDVRQVSDLNAFDLLRRKKVIFTKAAFESLSERLAAP